MSAPNKRPRSSPALDRDLPHSLANLIHSSVLFKRTRTISAALDISPPRSSTSVESVRFVGLGLEFLAQLIFLEALFEQRVS
jgi:hypothetical protein